MSYMKSSLIFFKIMLTKVLKTGYLNKAIQYGWQIL